MTPSTSSRARVPTAKLQPPSLHGVRRHRLTCLLTDDGPGIRIVHGVAGSGKTTALAHCAQAWDGRVVWLTADGTDRHGTRFSRALGAAAGVDAPVGDGEDGTDVVYRVIEALDARPEPTLLVIDDAHELAGAPPSEYLDLLCRYRPGHVTLALGTRHLRGLDRWHWPSEQVRELAGDRLRFRLWEIETLFRDHYQAPLSIDELYAITRLTDGWAVALHLLHVATRTLPAVERQHLVARPRLTVRSIREYIAQQVLATVDAEERRLLRRAAVLDRIRAERCERLLELPECSDRLRRLARAGLLVPEADGETYRLHELLRAHLLAELDDELGAGGVAGLHRLAADVLEAEGDIVEAVRACGRGGDWAGVSRLLASDHVSEVGISDVWADDLPSRLQENDPWVLRAIARRQMGEGDLDAARTTLASSLERFREQGGDDRTERNVRLLDGWLAPDPGQLHAWTACLRSALSGAPVERWPDDPTGWLGQGLAELFAGRVALAAELLRRAAMTLSGELGTLAELGLCLAVAFGESDPTPAAERALFRARATGGPALVRVAESLAAAASGQLVDLTAQRDATSERKHVLGEGVHAFVAGLAGLPRRPTAAATLLSEAARAWAAVGLAVPFALAAAAALLARACADPTTVADGELEGPKGRVVGPLPEALELLARARARGDGEASTKAWALARQYGFEGLLRRLEGADEASARKNEPPMPLGARMSPQEHIRVSRGVSLPPAGGSDEPRRVVELRYGPDGQRRDGAPSPSPSCPQMEVRCMGELSVARDGVACDLSRLRPRHQELLAILAAHPNRWLHRETLFDWLWPDSSPEKATRNLQVAISAVRRLVEPDAEPGHPRVVVRSGERYRMVVAEQASDVGRLELALRAAGAALRNGDVHVSADRLDEALAEWRGDPGQSAGPTDWAVERRRQLTHEVRKVSMDVVEVMRAEGRFERAVGLAALAVEVDPTDDQLWRLAVQVADEAGAAVLAADLEQRYHILCGT